MDRFLASIRPYVPGCSDPWIERAVLTTAIRFCVRSRIWQQETEHSLAAEDQAITLTVPTGSFVVAVKVSNALRCIVSYTLAGAVITFDDAVSSATDITVVAFLRPARAAEALPDILYDDWFEGVEAGAKAELMMMPGKPWTNMDMAGLNQRQYHHEAGEANIVANKKNSQDVLMVRPRRFI